MDAIKVMEEANRNHRRFPDWEYVLYFTIFAIETALAFLVSIEQYPWGSDRILCITGLMAGTVKFSCLFTLGSLGMCRIPAGDSHKSLQLLGLLLSLGAQVRDPPPSLSTS